MILTFLAPPNTVIDVILIIIVTVVLLTGLQLLTFLFVDDSYEQIGGIIFVGKENKICSNCGNVLIDTVTIGTFCSRCNIEFLEERVT